MTPHSSSPHRRALALAALVATLASAFVALSLPGTAMATPCGDKVLADWFDNGRIDRLYPPHCYEDAIDAIPDDLSNYANAEDVISRALQGALRGELVAGGTDPTPDPNPVDHPPPNGPNPPDEPNGDPTAAPPNVDTSGPSSLPIPLLVLGAMSLALLAAGGLGYLSRRRAAATGDGDEPPGPDDLL